MTGRDRTMTAPELLSAMLQALGQALPFAVLRNYERLPEAWGNDVDIVIRPGDLPAARRVAADVLRRSGKDDEAKILERFCFWSVHVPCSDRELQVDFYTAITKGWLRYADAGDVLAARRQVHPLFCAPDPIHELLLIAAKELFAYGRIRQRYHARLAGHELMDAAIAATALFSGRLTKKGCHLVACALKHPTVTGRPAVHVNALLHASDFLTWVRKRRASWLPLAALGEYTRNAPRSRGAPPAKATSSKLPRVDDP